jgi:hypothetical protein
MPADRPSLLATWSETKRHGKSSFGWDGSHSEDHKNAAMDEPVLARLIDEYHASVKAYSEAVSRLSGLDRPEFDEAYKRSEEAREECEARRAALRDYERTRGL